jgi:hypothetical protein
MPRPSHLLPKLRTLELDGQPIDLNYFLTTDYVDAASAGSEIPGLIEFINENYQVFVEQKIRSKGALERARAKAYFDLKAGLWETRGYAGKFTESGAEKSVELEEEVIDALEQYAVFSGYVARLYNLMQTLQAKLGITRTVEATRRAMLDDADRPSEE